MRGTPKGEFMKKALIFFVIIAALASLASCLPRGEMKDTEGVEYRVSSDGSYAEVIKYKGDAVRVFVASEHQGLPVRRICDMAFRGCDVRYVNLPESVVSIGEGAFMDCTSLASFICGKGIEEVGEAAFAGCESLRGSVYERCEYLGSFESPYVILLRCNSDATGVISLHGDTRVIASSAFADMKFLREVKLPEGLRIISDHAFDGCESLEKISLPSSLREIGSYAFTSCKALRSIDIPDGVSEIRTKTFHSCSSLEWVALPEGITAIGNGAFYNCSRLSSIVIPDSVVSIGQGAFYYCADAVALCIGRGVRSIGDSAFYHCDSVTELSLPNGGVYVGPEAFANCHGITELVLPQGTTLSRRSFANCGRLTTVTSADTGVLLDVSSFEDCEALTEMEVGCALLEYLPKGRIRRLTVKGDGSSVIGRKAYLGATALEELRIRGVAKISSEAFGDCASLVSVEVLDSRLSVNAHAFRDCRALRKFVLPEEAEMIYCSAFDGCDAELLRIEFRDATGWSLGGDAVDEGILSDPIAATEYVTANGSLGILVRENE